MRPSEFRDPSAPDAVIRIEGLAKRYASGFEALKGVSLEIRRGEIFALLGPNGAGKTTLISIVCGLVNPSAGTVTVDGHDIARDYRRARNAIGLVPQELTTDAFETVFDTVSFTRGLFGKPKDPAHVEKVLKSLSLWDKRNNKIIELSGGMKRRVLIAKALAHEPQVLFLDEPTAGVDVALRQDMWNLVRELRETGVTVILTTHYIEEAEEMADRVGVINRGELVLVEEKTALMRKLGRKEISFQLREPLSAVPEGLAPFDLALGENGTRLTYAYDAKAARTGINTLIEALRNAGVQFSDIETKQSSLEEIFVGLVKEQA
ncbi:MAG: ABC transporter ATP-binding protein [Methylobacterium mesophilicum]|nr:ABC transporter ATP-binding protein [Methylobacterium mesophilicum]